MVAWRPGHRKGTGKETDGHYTLVEVLEPEGEQPFPRAPTARRRLLGLEGD